MSINWWALLLGPIVGFIVATVLAVTSLPVMTRLARRWYRLVTWGMPEEQRERKLAVAENLIYEVLNDPQHLIRHRQEQQVALLLTWQVAGGAWEDIRLWVEAGVPQGLFGQFAYRMTHPVKDVRLAVRMSITMASVILFNGITFALIRLIDGELAVNKALASVLIVTAVSAAVFLILDRIASDISPPHTAVKRSRGKDKA